MERLRRLLFNMGEIGQRVVRGGLSPSEVVRYGVQPFPHRCSFGERGPMTVRVTVAVGATMTGCFLMCSLRVCEAPMLEYTCVSSLPPYCLPVLLGGCNAVGIGYFD